MAITQVKLQPVSRSLNERFKTLYPILAGLYFPIFCSLLLMASQTKIPIWHLTRDPLAIADQPFYFGILSNIGILFWCSTAAICFFSYAVLRKVGNKRKTSFLLSSGLLTSVLLLDDFFMLHEVVFPKYFHISEKLVLVGYGVMLLLYLSKFIKIIAKTEYLPLLIGFGLFGFSIICDQILIPFTNSFLNSEIELIFEDGAKLLGIASWFIYLVMVSLEQVRTCLFDGVHHKV